MSYTESQWVPPPLPEHMKEETNQRSHHGSVWSPPPLPKHMKDEDRNQNAFSFLRKLCVFEWLCASVPQKALGDFNIQIQGDDKFIRNTQKALQLIKQHSPAHYEMVEQHIGRIQQHEKSGMAAFWDTPTFLVGRKTSNSSTHWYASCIVHDAHHSKLFHDTLQKFGYVPKEAWTGKTAEMACLDIQESFLKTSKAPKRHLSSIDKARTYDYWSDYKARNW